MIKDIKQLQDQIARISPQTTSRELEEIDKKFQSLISLAPGNRAILLNYNEFRVMNASKLKKTRPQILIGGPAGIIYPNLHIYPLFEVADVICCTCTSQPLSLHSAIYCTPTTLFFDILNKLPQGFEPDFYWDNQIEHMHYIPAGIEMAPFPIVASLCHIYLHKSVEHVCELFDRVLPLSKFHGELLKKKYSDKIIDLPFGVNWGSFDDSIIPSWDKSIDVLVAFEESNEAVYYNKRNSVLDLVKKFKEKYGSRYSIEIVPRVSKEKYLALLKHSRIAINVTGVHGPYNYRTMESISSGSMVFQYDWSDEFFKNDFSELYVDGVHGASFNFENFETKLLYYLEHRDEAEKIARNAYTYSKENYSYVSLYKKLIAVIKNSEFKPRKLPNQIGFHHVDMIYYYQNNIMTTFMNYGVVSYNETRTWIHANNLMIGTGEGTEEGLYHALLVSMASRSIADLKKADLWLLCCKYYEEALGLAPEEFAWIIKWNFLLLGLEKHRVERKDVQNMIQILKELVPKPFDEEQIIFKYYVNLPNLPSYCLGASNVGFIQLNIELLKVLDKPTERVLLYRQYALKACEYFYEQLSA